MGLDLSSVRASAKDIKASKGAGKFFKCQDGKNVLRLFTYRSAVTGKDRLERAIRKHYKLDNATPLCQKTPAPNGKAISECEFCDRVAEIGAAEGEEVAKRLSANKKYTVNVVPVIVGDNPVEGALKMVQFDMPTSVIEAVLAVLDDSGDPDSFLNLNGMDLAINYDSKADPKRMYTAMFRNEAQSRPTTAKLKAVGAALLKQVVDLDSDPALLPDWWIAEQKAGGPKKGAKAAAPVEPDADAPVDDGSDAIGDPVDEPVEPTEGEPVAEPEPATDEPVDPVWEGDPLPDGVEAFWSENKEKFYFTRPNGKPTFSEEEARASVGPSKPKAGAKPKAAAPAVAAKPPAAKPGGKAAAAAPAKKGGKR